MFSVMILALNEEIHLQRCIERAKKYSDDIVVIDSHSTDDTAKIAKEQNVRLHNVSCNFFYEKFNAALAQVKFKYPWVMRIDADEYLLDEGISAFVRDLERVDSEVSAFNVKREIFFLGKKIKWGKVGNQYSPRLFKPNFVLCENRKLDEYLVLKNGHMHWSPLTIVDDPLSPFTEWVIKHLRYASLEAEAHCAVCNEKVDLDISAKIRRSLRSVYYVMPIFLRALAYFVVRYVFLLGFLDGRHGFLFHFAHAFWYRLTIDLFILSQRITKK